MINARQCTTPAVTSLTIRDQPLYFNKEAAIKASYTSSTFRYVYRLICQAP